MTVRPIACPPSNFDEAHQLGRVSFFRQLATSGAFFAAEKRDEVASGTAAVRQYLHAIHACPTASVAWLNASEVREKNIICLLLTTSKPRSTNGETGN